MNEQFKEEKDPVLEKIDKIGINKKILISIIVVLIIVIGIVGYLVFQKLIVQDECGDGICEDIEKEEGIFLDSGWSEPVRLTNDDAFSTLGPNFVHNLAVEGNNLYLVFGDTRNGNLEIFIKYSQNLGDTWSEDIRLTENNGISRVPSVAANDYVHIIWNDNTNGIEENYYMRSTDEGKTFGDSLKLSDSSAKSWSPSISQIL